MTGQKISIVIDVSKIDKTKLVERTFTRKDGTVATVKELKLDIVPLKEIRMIKDSDTWTLLKTHFVAEQQTKEERANGIKSHIIGEGTMFENKEVPVEDKTIQTGDENESEIPF